MTDLIIQAYHVRDEILHDEIYLELKRLDQSIALNYRNEIVSFNQAKESFDRIHQEGGMYHPDYKDASKKLSETKKALYETLEMKRYLELERKLQTELNTFLNDLTEAISPHIKTPDVFGIIKKGGSCHVR